MQKAHSKLNVSYIIFCIIQQCPYSKLAKFFENKTFDFRTKKNMTDIQITHDKLMLSLKQQLAYSNLAKCFENKHLTLRLQ